MKAKKDNLIILSQEEIRNINGGFLGLIEILGGTVALTWFGKDVVYEIGYSLGKWIKEEASN